MLWHFIRYCVTITFPVFYKRIQEKNAHYAMLKGPVVLAMNHPNAFTDPIAVTFVTYPTKLKYLARGDAFKPGLVALMLEWLGIVPIFRIQDAGKEGLKKNDETYRRVNELLSKDHKIIVFAEGLCIQERRLRPLKKGVARMVFGANDHLEHDDLVVVPVGVNYSAPDKIRSTLFYNFGEPIYVNDFIQDYRENEAKAYNKFLQTLEPRMKELIVHVNNSDYDDTNLQMDELLIRAMRKDKGYDERNLEQDHLIRVEIAAMLNRAEENNKALLDEFSGASSEYFSDLRKAGLRDWLIDPLNRSRLNSFNFFTSWILLIMGMPFFLVGLTGNILPYWLAQYIANRVLRVKKEFYSSITLAVGIFLLLANYILLFSLIYFFSPNVLCPLVSCLAAFFCGIFALDFQFFIQKTLGLGRALRNKAQFEQFEKRREKLISLINRF